jgi:DNA polymerase-3 subunit beta
MRFKTSKENLIYGIQIVQNIVSSKITLPILSNILIEAKKDILKLNTTDLDIGISCEIPVETLEEGAITVPAKRFGDIVRELPLGDIVVSVKKNYQVDIEGKQCRFKLNGLPKDEFPKFPEFKDKEAIQMDQPVVRDMLRLTAFSASHEESRYVLNGVLMEISKDLIRMVATDGRRLAKIERILQKPIQKDIAVIIPIKAVQEISRNLKEEGELTLIVGTNQILFDINGVLIATRVIEGEFPNYDQVIPKQNKNKIKIDTQEFLASIRRANLLSTQDFQAIKFEVFSDKLVISKSTPDVGESREVIPIQHQGEEMIVGFNPQFFIDFLKNIDDAQIEMELSGPDKPAVMRLPDYLYLALPMRI